MSAVTVKTKVILRVQIDLLQTRSIYGNFNLSELNQIRSDPAISRKDIFFTICTGLSFYTVEILQREGTDHEEKLKELVGLVKLWLYRNKAVYKHTESETPAEKPLPARPSGGDWVYSRQYLRPSPRFETLV